MTQVFQIGDIVRVRNHTDEEKNRYIHGWSDFMDEFETKRCIVVEVEQTRCDGIAYSLVPLKPNSVVAPGASKQSLTIPNSGSFSFTPDSLVMVQPSPWRDAIINGLRIPMIGDAVPAEFSDPKKTVTFLRWSCSGVTINRTKLDIPVIPKPAFTTF